MPPAVPHRCVLVTLVLALLVAALPFASLGCTQPDRADGRPVVLVSVLPQRWFVERIAGDLVETVVLIPPGASPATYEPTIGQMRAVARSDLYLSVGHPRFPFERAWLPKLTEQREGLAIVNSTAGVEYDPRDPHVWTSPQNGRAIAANVCDALIELLPAHREEFETRLAELLSEIDTLDAELRVALSPHEGRSVFVFHPAWGYLLDAYGIRQIPVERDGKEPTGQHLAQVIASARRGGVRVIFVQPQFSRQSVEVLAAEIDGTVVPLDPLAEDWAANLRRVSAAFRDALEP